MKTPIASWGHIGDSGKENGNCRSDAKPPPTFRYSDEHRKPR